MLTAIAAVVAFVLGVVFAPAIRTDIVNMEDHLKATYAAEKAALAAAKENLKAAAQKKISKL